MMKNFYLGPLLAAFLPVAAVAESPPAFPDFTFKREKAPKPGVGKRIKVQIQPGDQLLPSERKALAAKPEAEAAPKMPVPAIASSYGWFWETVPTEIDHNSAARYISAMERLANPVGGGVHGPRLQNLQALAQAHGADILRATIGTRVSPALVLAVISVESSGKSDAVSSAGAQGLMQLMPDTAKRFGVTDSTIAGQNIKGGVAYLDWLLGEFEGDALLALAGYNAGENAVKKHKGVPPFAETRDYIPKVLAAFDVASGLCKTRPQLISDGCALMLASN